MVKVYPGIFSLCAEMITQAVKWYDEVHVGEALIFIIIISSSCSRHADDTTSATMCLETRIAS